MSLAKLTELGAEFVAGTAILNREEVGRWSGGEFVVLPAGETALAAAAAVAAKGRKRATQAEPDPVQLADLDALAGS